MTPDERLVDRAAGCLWGLAIGDALGMPTQSLSPSRIRAEFGSVVDFVVPGPHQPIAAGLPAGSVTDDTEQALLLADLIGPDGVVDEGSWVRALVDWEQTMRARGSLDLLGPSTKAALAALQAGESPDRSGAGGATNGAAMRIAPMGIAVPADDLDHLVGRVVGMSRLTHGTSLGLGAAAAVAAAISASLSAPDPAITSTSLDAAIGLAVEAATLAEAAGRWVAGGLVSARIVWATERIGDKDNAEAIRFLAGSVGTSLAANESVPAAFGLGRRFADDPWHAVCVAASIGGDCDTIAAITGAILGAVHGMAAWPSRAVATVRDVNRLGRIDAVAGRLVAVRQGSAT